MKGRVTSRTYLTAFTYFRKATRQHDIRFATTYSERRIPDTEGGIMRGLLQIHSPPN